MKIRKLKSGIEILTDVDDCGYKRHTAVDPNGYIGRTRIACSCNYNFLLSEIREYLGNKKMVERRG